MADKRGSPDRHASDGSSSQWPVASPPSRMPNAAPLDPIGLDPFGLHTIAYGTDEE